MNVATEYLFGKGKVALGERDNSGGISKILYTGNCPELKISSSTEKVQHYESMSGSNIQDREIVKSVAMQFSVTLENISEDILALLVWGAKNTIAAAPTQTHTFPTVAAGEIHVVPNGFNLTTTSLKDAAGSPVTVPTTKYDLDAVFGTIKFIDIATYVQPFTLHYDAGAGVGVPFFTTQRPSRFLRFEGLNIGNPGSTYSQKFLVELYNAALDPTADLSLIGDDFGKFELKGSLQLDETRNSNSSLGGFGRIIKL